MRRSSTHEKKPDSPPLGENAASVRQVKAAFSLLFRLGSQAPRNEHPAEHCPRKMEPDSRALHASSLVTEAITH
jgi:hypothetical protein